MLVQNEVGRQEYKSITLTVQEQIYSSNQRPRIVSQETIEESQSVS